MVWPKSILFQFCPSNKILIEANLGKIHHQQFFIFQLKYTDALVECLKRKMGLIALESEYEREAFQLNYQMHEIQGNFVASTYIKHIINVRQDTMIIIFILKT